MEETKITININTIEDIKVVVLEGQIDANTAPSVKTEVAPLVTPESKIMLDMTGVEYMSSAGLRILLGMYRQSIETNAKLVLVGLNEELKDTMDATGFLKFFVNTQDRTAGLAALKLEALK